MTVAELIAALQALADPDALVVVRGASGPCDEPYIDPVSAPQALAVVRRTIKAGRYAGHFSLEEPSRVNAGAEQEVVYDISGWGPA